MTLFISYDFFILNITSLSYNNDSNPFSLAKWIRFLRLLNILIMMSWSISVAHFLILRILFWDIFWHISCSKHGTIMYCTILEFSESLFFYHGCGVFEISRIGEKIAKTCVNFFFPQSLCAFTTSKFSRVFLHKNFFKCRIENRNYIRWIILLTMECAT